MPTARSNARPIRFHVSALNPGTRSFEVRMTVPDPGHALRLQWPVWMPGSYMVREFARNVWDLTAEGPDGQELSVRKTDKRTWRVAARGLPEAVVRYRVFAGELSVRTAYLSAERGFFNGANLFPQPVGRDGPVEVSLEHPMGWTVATGLPEIGPARYQAGDYHGLYDAIFSLAPHAFHRFTAAGCEHRIAVAGGRLEDPHAWVDRLRNMIEEMGRLFGEVPCERYLFQLALTGGEIGGVEHEDSTAVLWPGFGQRDPRQRQALLRLFSHEYFHLWNIKRIMPASLVPIDYGRENYTRLLWVFEGITSYYDSLLLVRAGLWKPEEYLTRLSERITRLRNLPGRLHQSAELASFDTWIKYYRPDSNSPNVAASYYLKGGQVAWLLDAEIRRRTRGERSLDDVMRHLWQHHRREQGGLPEDAMPAVIREATGVRLGGLLERWTAGTGDLDYRVALRTLGLRMEERPRSPGRAWIGATPRPGSTQVAHVLAGGPAMAAGLQGGDEIIALDGYRVGPTTLIRRLQACQPGRQIRLSLFREGRLLETEVELVEAPHVELAIRPNPRSGQRARQMRADWLNGA